MLLKIFEIAKSFRSGEDTNSPDHLFEFTMLEWYNTQLSYRQLAMEVAGFINFSLTAFHHKKAAITEVSVTRVFQEYMGIDLGEQFLVSNTWDFIIDLAINKGLSLDKKKISLDDAYYYLFLNFVEPKLLENNREKILILYDYPSFQGAMAKATSQCDGFTERFEVYFRGKELANGYGELCDSALLMKRLKEFASINSEPYGRRFEVDMDFLNSLDDIPQASGVALGLDRLMMILLGAVSIQELSPFGY